MSCTIEIKRKRVFIVGDQTFENRKEAQEYLERYPYEYDGERYSTKCRVRDEIEDQKKREIFDVFKDTTNCNVWHYDATYVNAGGGHRLLRAVGNLEFLKKALQIAEKYDRLMEPFKENNE
jgi:hypothetical protein